MVLIKVGWEIFQKFMIDSDVFVEETDEMWRVYLNRNRVDFICEVLKQDETGNIAFVDRYLLKPNVYRVPKIILQQSIKLSVSDETLE